MTHDEVIQHLQGGQVQVSGQHVPLLGHGDAIESTNSNPFHVDEIWHHWWCHQCLHSPMTHHSLEASRRYLTFLFVVIWHHSNLMWLFFPISIYIRVKKVRAMRCSSVTISPASGSSYEMFRFPFRFVLWDVQISPGLLFLGDIQTSQSMNRFQH